ncbi:MAG: amino acid ABC transporter substrate-binding protein [Hyphomicrobiales bacterium]|nr:amino acid ABC transporter substrate-binding protein [Hyphomicrobiales bacterium]
MTLSIRYSLLTIRSLAWLALAAFMLATAPALAAEPIKVGFSMALTGAVAPNGRQLLLALEIWRDDVNAKGGLLGRPIDLVYYDDQSNPANVPGIYTKLISVDNVDLLIGPYATNMAAPAMPVIMAAGKTTISMLAIGVNRHFNYSRYFAMVPVGPEGVKAFSRGFFELAAAQQPKPRSVALIAADAEFARTAADGARENAQTLGFSLVYDKSYPPATTDFTPVVRSIQAANADVVFVAAYPPDTVGIVRAASEIGLTPKMFGGAMVGLLVTPIKLQLGPAMNGLVIQQSFLPAPKLDFPGLPDLLQKYQAKAAGQQIDPFGYAFAPFGYAAGQILAAAVEETESLDHARIAQYIHAHTFATVVGDIAYGEDGEWTAARTLFTQFQNVAPNNLEQFRTAAREVILWPEPYRTGTMIYPYSVARK